MNNTTKTTADFQYEILKQFSEIHTPELPDSFTTQIIAMGKALLDLHGFYPSNIKKATENEHSPIFMEFAAEDINLEQNIYVLPFYQTGTEEHFSPAPDTQSELTQTNLFNFNSRLIQAIQNPALEQFYFRIHFNVQQHNKDNPHHILLITFSQLKAIHDILNSIFHVQSPSKDLQNMWSSIAHKRLRTELYQYAQQHTDIAKLWIYILSNTLFVHYELESQNYEHTHRHAIDNIIKPYIQDPLFHTVSPITEGIKIFGEENEVGLKHQAAFYDQSQWQFWLLNWLRIYKSTTMFKVSNHQASSS